jgi:hypothetical protein
MSRPLFFLPMSGRLARWASALVLIACLGVSGCCGNCNLRGESFADDSFASQGRAMRTADRNNELFGVSNKAQQIERDVGVK